MFHELREQENAPWRRAILNKYFSNTMKEIKEKSRCSTSLFDVRCKQTPVHHHGDGGDVIIITFLGRKLR